MDVKKGIGNIKFPASVPATLQKAMSSILPLTLCFLVGCLASGLTTQLLGVSIPDLVMMIGRPITKVLIILLLNLESHSFLILAIGLEFIQLQLKHLSTQFYMLI